MIYMKGAAVLVGLIFLLSLISLLYHYIIASPVGNCGSSIVYEQDRRSNNGDAEPERQASPDVLVSTKGVKLRIDVTSDLIVKKNTCTARVYYGPGGTDFYEITPDNKNDSKDSRSLTVG